MLPNLCWIYCDSRGKNKWEKNSALSKKAIEDVRQGKMIVIVDDEDRENEGDLMIAAEKVTPETDQLYGSIRTRFDLFDAHRKEDPRARALDDGG